MPTGSLLDAVLAGGLLDATHVVLQGASDVNQQFDPTTQAGGGFVLTLLVGAIMLSAAPNYVDQIVEEILEEPFASVGWGVLALVVFIGAAFLLAITIVGIVLVIPLVIIFFFAAIVGNVLAWIAVCDGFVDSRWVALLVAAIAAAVVGLVPVVGPIVGFFVSSAGLGAVTRRWVE